MTREAYLEEGLEALEAYLRACGTEPKLPLATAILLLGIAGVINSIRDGDLEVSATLVELTREHARATHQPKRTIQ